MNTLSLTRLQRTGLLALSICAALSASGCTPAGAKAPEADPTMKRISEEILIKKVCLDGVSYYATHMTDSVDSIAGQTYWIVGGAVFAKDSAIPVSCEK